MESVRGRAESAGGAGLVESAEGSGAASVSGTTGGGIGSPYRFCSESSTAFTRTMTG
jgi:hypothetical protein